MGNVRLGVIGFGNMGTAHAKNVYAGKVKRMTLTAVCDIASARLEKAKELFPDVALFDNAEELFGSGLCDAVIIAVPHYDHPQLVIKAFEAGLNVITEKPAGVYTKQVEEMNEVVSKSKPFMLPVMTAWESLFQPDISQFSTSHGSSGLGEDVLTRIIPRSPVRFST